MIKLPDNSQSSPTTPIPIDSMGNFLACAVHDMKNSLTLLLDGLEKTLASAETTSSPIYAELSQANHEAKRINHHLIQLLTIYKLGQKTYPFDPQLIALEDFLSALTAQFYNLLTLRKIHLEIYVDPKLYWYFDEELVAGALSNAVNNAMRFTRDRIRISAEEIDGKLILRVEDNGSGYPDWLLHTHHHHTHDNGFQQSNTGLGLFFSSLVARMHRNREYTGELILKNNCSLPGACFELRLP